MRRRVTVRIPCPRARQWAVWRVQVMRKFKTMPTAIAARIRSPFQRAARNAHLAPGRSSIQAADGLTRMTCTARTPTEIAVGTTRSLKTTRRRVATRSVWRGPTRIFGRAPDTNGLDGTTIATARHTPGQFPHAIHYAARLLPGRSSIKPVDGLAGMTCMGRTLMAIAAHTRRLLNTTIPRRVATPAEAPAAQAAPAVQAAAPASGPSTAGISQISGVPLRQVPMGRLVGNTSIRRGHLARGTRAAIR